MDDTINVICTMCGASLIPDEEKKIYRCDHCGMAYGSSILFDRNGCVKGSKSLEAGEFNDADVRFRCALMLKPNNFTALRGRILCAAKWKDFTEASDSTYLPVFRKKNIRDCIEEAIKNADEEDKKYFDLCMKLLDDIELTSTSVDQKMKPITARRQRLIEDLNQTRQQILDAEKAREAK